MVSLWLLRATPEDAELALGSVWAGLRGCTYKMRWYSIVASFFENRSLWVSMFDSLVLSLADPQVDTGSSAPALSLMVRDCGCCRCSATVGLETGVVSSWATPEGMELGPLTLGGLLSSNEGELRECTSSRHKSDGMHHVRSAAAGVDLVGSVEGYVLSCSSLSGTVGGLPGHITKCPSSLFLLSRGDFNVGEEWGDGVSAGMQTTLLQYNFKSQSKNNSFGYK